MGVLDGKSAIVTGSARGIGRATAELLVSQGAQDRTRSRQQAVLARGCGELAETRAQDEATLQVTRD